MIPKAEILEAARETGLLATTVEKDYVLGWVLAAIAEHVEVSEWVFKGGTCLKKCYFDTYRFSEDLDFTIPDGVQYDLGTMSRAWRPLLHRCTIGLVSSSLSMGSTCASR